MDFFSHQDRARRNTGRLVFLFVLAILGIVGATYLLVAGVMTGFSGSPEAMMRPELLLGIGAGVLLVVGGGSAYKLAQLSAGGQVVALHLGGRLVSNDARDPLDRKLLNVVEEMAIASGVPVPPVYLMDDEPNINAFAAGYSPSDAVIGVTRGCVEKLNRDQLQGVIAHEFSHILNGDMRLNIRLIGMLHGILLIGLIGYYILRSAMYSWHGYRRSNSRNQGNPLPLLALGGGLMAVGFIGTFFGNMIKAAVSRQREFLADASAVQFTRNPEGLGGALRAIGGYATGSKVLSPNAPEASHMFFGQAITSGLAGLFATHPPLDERIRRIDRSWEIEKSERGTGGGFGVQGSGFSAESRVPVSALAGAGQLTEPHVAHAQGLLAGVPVPILEAAHEPFAARALVYALLMDPKPEVARMQVVLLQRSGDDAAASEVAKLLPHTQRLNAEARLPLIDIAIGTLHRLTKTQHAQFIATVDALVRADRSISLFEWVLRRVILHHLAPPAAAKAKHRALEAVAAEASVMLSALAYAGHRTPEEAGRAFEAGRAHTEAASLLPLDSCGLDRLEQALPELSALDAQGKRKLLTAAAAVIAADHRVTVGESELFRALADTLGVPIPPLLPGQGLA